MTTLLLVLLTLSSQADLVLPPSARALPVDAQDQQDPQEAFDELRGRYQAALDAHSHEIRRLHQERVPEDRWPAHPAPEWLERFEAVAESGAGRADLWILSNLNLLAPERPRQLELAVTSLRRLVDQHSDQPFMIDVFEYTVRRRGLIGRETSLELLTRLSEESSNPEIAARALYELALLISDRLTSEDPEVIQQSMDLLRIAVDGYAGTEGAKFAADPLFNRSLARLWKDISDWAERARSLADQGVPSDQWPAFPLETVKPELLACSLTAHPMAEEWINVYFPAFEQAARRGFADGLFEFTRTFYRRAPAVTGPSVDARFSVMQLLAEVWPDDPVMLELTSELLAFANHYPAERYRPLVETLTERTTREDVRHPAWLALGQILMRSNHEEEIDEALSLLSKVEEKAPQAASREVAGEARRALEALLPGKPAPGFAVTDSEGFRLTTELYRGRVMLLVFWSLSDRGSQAVLPELNRLHSHFEGRPFNVVGMNVDLIMPTEFRRQAREHDIAWRNAMLGTRSEAARSYGARSIPLAILIDGDGVIRARGLPLAAGGAAERIEPFVQSAEAKALEKQSDR